MVYWLVRRLHCPDALGVAAPGNSNLNVDLRAASSLDAKVTRRNKSLNDESPCPQLRQLDAQISGHRDRWNGGQSRKLARGIVDRIGGSAAYSFKTDSGAPKEKALAVANHEVAVRLVIDWLRSQPELSVIDAVGHRVVHGADRFANSVLIDDAVIVELEELCEIAPLHNPGAVSGIRAARKIFGDAVPMVAAFDTSFHHMIPEHAALYAIPYELSQKHKIRRYGFHGLAHRVRCRALR